MAVKLHDIMLDNNVDLFDYEGEMEFVPIDDGKFYKLKDDNVKYRCLVKVNMINLDRYLTFRVVARHARALRPPR